MEEYTLDELMEEVYRRSHYNAEQTDKALLEYEKEIEILNNTIDEIKEKIDDYFAYDYENESMARLDVINEINCIIVEVKEGKENEK